MKRYHKTQRLSRKVLSRGDLRRLGIWQSNSTLLRHEATGRFPRRARFSGSTVFWDHDEIMAWIEARKAERATWHYADTD